MALISDYNDKIKKYTPLIRPIPYSGGIMYASQESSNHLILNWSPQTTNDVKFAFSKFALLKIPDFNPSEVNKNGMKLQVMQGNFKQTQDSINTDINNKFAEYFQNFILNFETGLLNLNTYKSDMSSTVFERVFWHSLINIGAIRFENNINGSPEDHPLYTEEQNNPENYDSVVKYLGEINYTGIADNQSAIYQKVYLHVPDDVGTSKVLFDTYFDNNYNPSLNINRVDDGLNNRYIFGWNTETVHPNNLDTRAIYDNDGTLTKFPISPEQYLLNPSQTGFFTFKQNLLEPYNVLTETEADSVLFYGAHNLNPNLGFPQWSNQFWIGPWENQWWYTSPDDYLKNNSYIIDGSFEDDRIGIRTDQYGIFSGEISRLGNVTSGFTTNNLLRFKRTNLDGVRINWNLDNYNFGTDENFKSLLDVARSNNSKSFEFNAILLYYDVFTHIDGTGRPIDPTTNLFGVLFLDDVEVINPSTNLSRIQSFIKEMSNGREDRNGNEYGFKLNFRVDTNTSANPVNRINVITETDTMGLTMYLELFEKMVKTSQIFSDQEFKFLTLNQKIQDVLALQQNFQDVAQLEQRLSALESLMITQRETALLQNLGQIYDKYVEVGEQISELMNGRTNIQLLLDTNMLTTSDRIQIFRDGNNVKLDTNANFYNYVSNPVIKINDFIQRLNNTSGGNWWQLNLNLGKNNTYYRFADRVWDLNLDTYIGNNIRIFIDGKWEVGQTLKFYLENRIVVPEGFVIDIYCKNIVSNTFERCSTFNSFGNRGVEIHCLDYGRNNLPELFVDRI